MKNEPQSLVIACAFAVDDVDNMWAWIQQHQEGLATIGTRHLVLYESVWEPGRVFVTTGVRRQQSIRRLLQSPKLFEWFDAAGVEDIPPVFGGEMVEKIDLIEQTQQAPEDAVMLGVISTVDDVNALVAHVHSAAAQFRSAGVRKVWIYRALDDRHEVMILEEVDTEDNVRKWIAKPHAAAEWMSGAGLGAYPPMFVGRVTHLMTMGSS